MTEPECIAGISVSTVTKGAVGKAWLQIVMDAGINLS